MLAEKAEIIHWHPGFYGAVELELKQNKSDLIFENEHQLSKEPLRMDMLIINISCYRNNVVCYADYCYKGIAEGNT